MAPQVEDLRETAFHAQKDLNSYQAKQGTGKKSDSAVESGVDEKVDQRFNEPTTLKYGPGSTASGSENRKVPEDEGGTRDDRGHLPTAKQFRGEGGPETDIKIQSEARPGDQDSLNLQEMKRRGIAGETIR